MANLPAQGEGFKKTPQELAAYNAACPPTGSYYARIFKFVHIGTVDTTYMNKPTVSDKFYMYMEFLTHSYFIFDEKKGQQPWTCNVKATYSTAEKSHLYKYIMNVFKADPAIKEAVIKGRFDVSNLMDKLVMVDIQQKISDKGQANIKVTNVTSPLIIPGYDIMPLTTKKLYNEYVMFDIDEFVKRNPRDIAAFKKLYKFEQKDIAGSHEFVQAGLRLDDFVQPQAETQQYGYNQQPQQGFQQPTYQQPAQHRNSSEPDDLPF